MLPKTSTTAQSFWKWEKIKDLAERGTRVRVIASEPITGYSIWEGRLMHVSDSAFAVGDLVGDTAETRSTVVLQYRDVRHIDSALFDVEGDTTCPPPENFAIVPEESTTGLETVVCNCFSDLREAVKSIRFYPEQRENIKDAMILPASLRHIAETTTTRLWFISLIDRRSRLFPCLTVTISIKQHLYERLRDIEVEAYERFIPLDERYARENAISGNLRALPQRSVLGRLRAAWAALFPPRFSDDHVAFGNSALRSNEDFPVQFITCECTAHGTIIVVRS